MPLMSALRIDPDIARPLYVPSGYIHWQYNLKRISVFAALQSLLCTSPTLRYRSSMVPWSTRSARLSSIDHATILPPFPDVESGWCTLLSMLASA